MPRRNRVVVILTAPIAIILYIIGLIFTYLGSKQKPVEPKIPEQKEFSVIVPSQEEEISLKKSSKS